ncbi:MULTISPECIES: phage holin family protein [Buttiauxella]|uniref:phage holin family protein n=1 Tax=Buttiauxella TaxID=82976 RepID=UPI00155FCC12|nr:MULTISPECIES: phage holin family protein [Buttiauxella]MCS3602534.1 hypothetical protein [Buttiauxella sp. BIGb0471]BCG09939.1 hypothetical protein BADSM9389_26100 [Buttiauxella agrestis]
MISAAHARDVIFIEPFIFFAIIGMAAWGGIVKRIMITQKKNSRVGIKVYLQQMVVSIFSGLILSIMVLSRNASDDRVLIVAGLGGVFSGPILTIISKKINTLIENLNPTVKKS